MHPRNGPAARSPLAAGGRSGRLAHRVLLILYNIILHFMYLPTCVCV